LLLRGPNEYQKVANAVNPYGDGKASERIVKTDHIIIGQKINPVKQERAKLLRREIQEKTVNRRKNF
jgi:UDP-N-acetylglucosamine 2-epimerase